MDTWINLVLLLLNTTMKSLKQTANRAGWLYFSFMITLMFSTISRSRLVISGDLSATITNILSSTWIFRLSYVGELISTFLFLLAAWALYLLLKKINKNIALLFFVLNFIGVSIQCISLLGQISVTELLSNSVYLKSLSSDQLNGFIMFSLNFYKNGFMIAQLFYGTWLLPLGYLVYKSGFLPKWLGVLLMIDFIGVVVWFLQYFLFPGYEIITYPGLTVSFIAEFALSICLILFGIKGKDDK